MRYQFQQQYGAQTLRNGRQCCQSSWWDLVRELTDTRDCMGYLHKQAGMRAVQPPPGGGAAGEPSALPSVSLLLQRVALGAAKFPAGYSSGLQLQCHEAVWPHVHACVSSVRLHGLFL